MDGIIKNVELEIKAINNAEEKDRERMQKEVENYSTESLKKMLEERKKSLKRIEYERENSNFITVSDPDEKKLNMEIDEIEKVLKNRE